MTKPLSKILRNMKKTVTELNQFCADTTKKIQANDDFIRRTEEENKELSQEWALARTAATNIEKLIGGSD